MGPRRGGSHLSPETRMVSESCGPKLSQRPRTNEDSAKKTMLQHPLIRHCPLSLSAIFLQLSPETPLRYALAATPTMFEYEERPYFFPSLYV